MAVPKVELQAALEQARRLIDEVSGDRVPIDIERVALALGVERIEARSMKLDGYLGRLDDRSLVIRYRAENGRWRNRFTIAHELGHILLARQQGREITQLNREYKRDDAEEIAVNRLASELLMPEAVVQRELLKREQQGEPPSWRTLTTLRHYFDVSESSMVIRILEIPSLWSILIRVNLDGPDQGGRLFICDRSKYADFHLAAPEAEEATRVWREAQRSNKHVVPVVSASGGRRIHCEGLRRELKTKQGRTFHQYWVVGWISTS